MKKSNTDTGIAAVLLLISVIFLVQRNIGYLAVWLLLITAVIGYGVRMPLTAAVTLGIFVVTVVVLISGQTLKERYENPVGGEKKEEPEPASSKKDSEPEPTDAHIDAGTTILHAFQKLDPAQVLQMRDDTKELMDTQKQLVETLASLGPQIKQGADLIQSFQGMFGGSLPDILKKE
jgi:hypothetical protein